MRIIAVGLLAIIATAVAYLAYSDYRRNELAASLARSLAPPPEHPWLAASGLECDVVTDTYSVPATRALPQYFVCWRGADQLEVNEIPCPEQEAFSSPGKTRSEGIYKPLPSVCWDVRLRR